jgi:hypothetical protein
VQQRSGVALELVARWVIIGPVNVQVMKFITVTRRVSDVKHDLCGQTRCFASSSKMHYRFHAQSDRNAVRVEVDRLWSSS